MCHSLSGTYETLFAMGSISMPSSREYASERNVHVLLCVMALQCILKCKYIESCAITITRIVSVLK